MGAIILTCAMLLALAVLETVRYRAPVSTPLGGDPEIHLPGVGFSEAAGRQFLDSDFKIVTDVRALPGPVLQTFTEQGGSRLLIANPGEEFEATDAISDPSLPRKQLVYAGIAGDRCFVYYMQGGIALGHVIDFFGMTSTKGMRPQWKRYCHVPAANIQDLPRCISTMRLHTQKGPP